MEQKHSDYEIQSTVSFGSGVPSIVEATTRSSNSRNNSSFASIIDPAITSAHSSTKRTFDWQLLPQKELDRIAYNSHKQRKARLKLNSPHCPQCPEARLTSAAMLATHLISKKHLMRVRKLGKSRPISSANREKKNKATNSSTGAQDVIVEDARSTLDEPQDKPDSVRLGPVRPLMENKPVDSVEMGKLRDSGKPENRGQTEKHEPTRNTANPERSKKPRKTGKRKLKKPAGSPKPEDLHMSGEGKLEVLKERETPKTAKEKSRRQMERSQAWRRLERSKKKEKRREIKDMVDIEESSTIIPGMPCGKNQSSTSTDTSMDIGLKNDTEKKNGLASHSPKTKKYKSTHKPSSEPDTIKHARGNNNFVADTTTSAKPLTSNNSAASTRNEPISQLFWNCSLCGSVWKQEKAWVGHLTSGQHMRRVLKAVRQTGPEIVPFDRLDILSANDPFGWGTGAGVVEEEDSEDDEAITEDDRQTNRVEEGTLENDDDDMDLEE